MFSALLLSAGLSRRMGTPKALLTYNGRTLMQHAAEHLQDAGAHVIAVVSAGRVHEEAQRLRLLMAANPRPEDGLLSSVKAGLLAIPETASGVLITLVDLPFLAADDFMLLPKGVQLSRFLYRGEPAHPVWIPRHHFAEILRAPREEKGCAFLFKKYAEDSILIEAPNANGVRDIDTPEDYHAHITT